MSFENLFLRRDSYGRFIILKKTQDKHGRIFLVEQSCHNLWVELIDLKKRRAIWKNRTVREKRRNEELTGYIKKLERARRFNASQADALTIKELRQKCNALDDDLFRLETKEKKEITKEIEKIEKRLKHSFQRKLEEQIKSKKQEILLLEKQKQDKLNEMIVVQGKKLNEKNRLLKEKDGLLKAREENKKIKVLFYLFDNCRHKKKAIPLSSVIFGTGFLKSVVERAVIDFGKANLIKSVKRKVKGRRKKVYWFSS